MMKFILAAAVMLFVQLFFAPSAKSEMLTPAQIQVQRYYANTVVIPINYGAAWQGAYGFGYNPLFILPGTRVIWVNHDNVPHTSTSNFGWWNTGVLHPGWGFQIFFGQYGDFPYHCQFYPGMWGRIIVR